VQINRRSSTNTGVPPESGRQITAIHVATTCTHEADPISVLCQQRLQRSLLLRLVRDEMLSAAKPLDKSSKMHRTLRIPASLRETRMSLPCTATLRHRPCFWRC